MPKSPDITHIKFGSPYWKRAIAISVLVIFALIRVSEASPIYPKNLYKGLIGESVSEGYQGMYAVACVYRNRLAKNMPLGCVALKRKDLNEFVRREGWKVEYIAKDIIRKVFEENAPDITQGATHYENIEKFGLPYWAKSLHKTVKIGNHTFYREK